MDLRIFTEPQQGATYETLLEVARTAERLGFDAFFRSDHYLAMGGDGLPGPTDAWITLAGLARDTSTIRLGTLVSPVTFRLPGPLAITVAQVDAMSGGRVELGIGTGWFEAEHTAWGIPFGSFAERFARLTEQLEILTGIWGTPVGSTFDHTGTHYRLRGCPAIPKPHQRPHPPIVMGGIGRRRTPALVARFADEFNAPFVPLEHYREVCDRVRRACEDAGRDPGTLRWSVALTTCCGADGAELARRADRIGRSLEDLRATQLAGTPAEIVERLHAWRDAGADRVYLQILDLADLDHLRLIAEAVLPHV